MQHSRRRNGSFLLEIAARRNTRPLLKFLWTSNTVHKSSFLYDGLPPEERQRRALGNIQCVSFPFPSSVRTIDTSDINSTANRPWIWTKERGERRKYLMSFGGSLNGMEDSVVLRKFLHSQCKKLGAPKCLPITSEKGFDLMEAAFQAKRESVFCLEPPGFGLERKSIIDSLSLGCIPVIFASARVWSYFWTSLWSSRMKRDMAVVFNGHDVVNGNVDLFEALAAISPERVRRMQEAISQNFHMLHYSNIDYPGDGMERALHILKRIAMRKRPHTCMDYINETSGIFPFELGDSLRQRRNECHLAECNKRIKVVNMHEGGDTQLPGFITMPNSMLCLKTCNVCTDQW
mmetsp:Transcript_27676/g.44587  ORF Transcript_27676/g.44587 Transcript_27676/m.44587 type:complete len:347 (-) Transcript_27676:100-1140(-)